ncbi:M15 family peptidase, partial [Clostridium perfringens]
MPLADLRYLRVLHRDFEGRTRRGELLCHRDIADDLAAIFRALYLAGYPIAQIRLVDDFDADDVRSME